MRTLSFLGSDLCQTSRVRAPAAEGPGIGGSAIGDKVGVVLDRHGEGSLGRDEGQQEREQGPNERRQRHGNERRRLNDR